MILPYPVVYVEDGVILLYFTNEDIKVTAYNFAYYEPADKVLCIFNDFYAVPIDLLEKSTLLRPGNKIYFMRYNFSSVEAVFCNEFTINQDFIIDLKAYSKLRELQKSNDKVLVEKAN